MKRRILLAGAAAGCLGLGCLTGCAGGQTETAAALESGETAGTGQEVLVAASEENVEINGNGAAWSEGKLRITEGGTYRITGSLTGQILVDAGEEDEVCLILDGCTISEEASSGIYAKQCGRLTVELEEGTENTVSDGEGYVYETEGDDEPDAAIFSKSDLVLRGTGSLTVLGNYKNGIRGKDMVRVESGSYAVTAADDGIKGTDWVEIVGGTLSLTAGGDGIQSNKGDVEILGGSLILSCQDDGICGEGNVTVSGGTVDIQKSNEGIEGLSIDITGGEISLISEDDGLNAAGSTDASEAPFEVTEGAYIRISGGSVEICASGDGIDSNGDFFMEGGTVYVEGPEHGGDGILDFSGTGTITGGVFTGIGNAGMLQLFDQEASQPVLLKYYDEIQKAGTETAVVAEDGSDIVRVTPSKDFSLLICSAPQLTEGAVIQVETGEETAEIIISGAVSQSGEAAAGEMRQPGGLGRGQEPPEGAEGGKPQEGEAQGRKPEGGMKGGRPQGDRPEDGSREEPEEPSDSAVDDANASEPVSDSGEEAP